MDVGIVVLIGLAARDYAASLSADGAGESGPFGVLDLWRKIGEHLDTSNRQVLHTIGYAMLCPICLSFWLGVLLLLAWAINPVVWAVLCLPGAAHAIAMLARRVEVWLDAHSNLT